jgi:hypothetical protein
MKTKSLVKPTRQIALPIRPYPTNLATSPAGETRTRATVVAVLARLLLEAIATSERSEAVHDES